LNSIYIVLALIISLLAPYGCSIKVASLDLVIAHIEDVQEFDTSKKVVQNKANFLFAAGQLNDLELRLKLSDINDASYVYYMAAHIRLAAGDIEGFGKNMAMAWELLEKNSAILDELYDDMSDKPKARGQGL